MKTGTTARIAATGAQGRRVHGPRFLGATLLASMLAVATLASGAKAEEQSEDLVLTDDVGGEELSALDSGALDEASGGFAVQISDTEQQTNFTDNPVTVDNGGQINTGSILASSANSGGISTMMLNTGNNVSFQNSTTLNIYLDGAQ